MIRRQREHGYCLPTLVELRMAVPPKKRVHGEMGAILALAFWPRLVHHQSPAETSPAIADRAHVSLPTAHPDEPRAQHPTGAHAIISPVEVQTCTKNVEPTAATNLKPAPRKRRLTVEASSLPSRCTVGDGPSYCPITAHLNSQSLRIVWDEQCPLAGLFLSKDVNPSTTSAL